MVRVHSLRPFTFKDLAASRSPRSRPFRDKCAETSIPAGETRGGGGLYGCNPLRHDFRDVHAIGAHVSFNFDIAGGQYGPAVLGMEADAGLL